MLIFLPKFVYVTDPPLMPTVLNIDDVVAGVVVIIDGFETMAPVFGKISFVLLLFC